MQSLLTARPVLESTTGLITAAAEVFSVTVVFIVTAVFSVVEVFSLPTCAGAMVVGADLSSSAVSAANAVASRCTAPLRSTDSSTPPTLSVTSSPSQPARRNGEVLFAIEG